MMKTTIITAALVHALVPALAVADRPSHNNLQQQINKLTAKVKKMDRQLKNTRKLLFKTRRQLARVKARTVLGLKGKLRVEVIDGVDTIVLEGVNLQLVNGTGMTAAPNGSGNLVIGYNADDSALARIGRINAHFTNVQQHLTAVDSLGNCAMHPESG
jgi:ethanolamine ammonia-lyase large subunit